MKFNALQKYILEVYAVAIIFLTVFVPTYTTSGTMSYGFVLFGYATTLNVAFLIIEYVASTLVLIALLLATNELRKK